MNYALGQGNRLAGWTVAETNPAALLDVAGFSSEPIGTDDRFGQLWVSASSTNKPAVSGTNFWVYGVAVNAGTQQVVAAIRDAAGNMGRATNSVVVNVVTSADYGYNAVGCVTNISYSGTGFALNLGLTWNGQYQLTALATNGVAAELNGYDALGRRIWTASGGVTNYFVYDGPHVVADVDAGGNLLRSYVWGPGIDNLLAMTLYGGPGAPRTVYALKDHLGSVYAMVDAAGAVVEQYRYDAWGRVLGVYDASGSPIGNQQSQIGNRYLWQGREISWATGLYYFRARWYDPVTGRWLSNDPIGISGGLNQYVFCANNPVNFRDPLGLVCHSALETQRILAKAYSDAIAGPIQGLENIAANSTDPRKFDFKIGASDDTFSVNGRIMHADAFGNYIAGFAAQAYDQIYSPFGVPFAQAAVKAAGIGYHVLDHSCPKEHFENANRPPVIV